MLLAMPEANLKVAILAGGLGTRLAEETEVIPKPMVDIGGHPILWHIMRHYARYGYHEFCIALGYKGAEIKRFFRDYVTLDGSMTIALEDGALTNHASERLNWTVHLIETGTGANTGGRVRRMAEWLKGDTFMLTYGDGVSDVDLSALLAFHRSHGRLATITAVRPPSRFGGVDLREDGTVAFVEKPQIGEGWINGGFMVFEPAVLDYIEDDDTSLEGDTLERLSADRELMAYLHGSFWQCMDTIRDLQLLRSLWTAGKAPWG